jgi:predicted nucleotidyltransferase
MISNLFEKNIVKILTYFLISPGSRYTRKEIKEKTKMNNVPLDNTLTKLKNLKLLNENKKIYELNFKIEKNKEIFGIISSEYKYFNIPHEVFNIILESEEKLAKNKTVKSMILFGSYAKLIHTENSDIDIAIITKSKTKKQTDKIKKETKRLNKKLELHFFEENDLKANDPLIKDILRNGKVIF